MAQNLTGSWDGILHSTIEGHGSARNLNLHLDLKHTGRSVSGTFSNTSGSSQRDINVVYEISGQIGSNNSYPFSMVRNKILMNRLNQGVAEAFIGFDNIKYTRNDTLEYLYGQWITTSGTAAGYFWVARRLVWKNDVVATNKILPVENLLSAGSKAVNLSYKERLDKIATEIKVPESAVTFEFFDNGDIDGDSVSVYVNDQLKIAHIKLKAEPYIMTLNLPNNKSHKITMLAENLGSIPPNTGVVIIRSGKFMQTLYLSADLQRNVSVMVRVEP